MTGEGGRVGAGSPRGGGPKDRASRKLLPSRKSSVRRTGDRRAKPSSAASRWATSGGERRTKPVAASKGRKGEDGAGRATWEHPEQSHGSNEMGGRRWFFLFVPLRVMVSLKPYSTQRVRKRGGGEGGGSKDAAVCGRRC